MNKLGGRVFIFLFFSGKELVRFIWGFICFWFMAKGVCKNYYDGNLDELISQTT